MNNEGTSKLLKLISENPGLPIVLMVDCGVVCGNDYGRWLASLGSASVGEYVCYDERYFDDRDDFKDRYFDNNEDDLCERFNYHPRINKYGIERGTCTAEQVAINEKNEKRLESYLSEVAERVFKRAIIVNADVPDDIDDIAETNI